MSKEPAIRAEFYRVLTNSAKIGVSLGDYKISNVAVEYPVDGKKADLVVFRRFSQQPDYTFLVIETKGRHIYPALSLARGTKQAMNYAKKLNSNFFAIYDGWNFLLFKMSYPYLIKLSNFLHIDESIARNLLLGLLEFYQTGHNTQTLERLPKIPDGWSFQQTILPSIAKSLASITAPEQADNWKVLKSQWFPIIQSDGAW